MFLLLFKAAGWWCKRNPVYPPHSAIKYNRSQLHAFVRSIPPGHTHQKKKPSTFAGKKLSVPSCSLNRVDFWRWIFSAFIKKLSKMPEILHFFTPQLGKLAQRPPATSPSNLKIFQSQGGSAGPCAGTIDVRPKNAGSWFWHSSFPPNNRKHLKATGDFHSLGWLVVWLSGTQRKHKSHLKSFDSKAHKIQFELWKIPILSDFQISGICSNPLMVHLKLKLKEIIKYQGDYFTIPPILGDD